MRQRYIVLALIVLIAVALMLPSSAISRDKDTSEPWDWKESGALGNGSARALAYDATRDILYRGTHRGVYKYQGGKFTSLGGDIEAYDVGCLAYDSTNNVLYAGTYTMVLAQATQGVWRCDSPDSSPSWTRLGPVFEYDSYPPVFSLAHDPVHNVLYAGISANLQAGDGGVWRCDSPNTNPTWTDTKGTLGNYIVWSLAYDSTRNLLYAGAENQGVWRCLDPNTSPVWVRISTSGNVGDSIIKCLAYDSANNILYAGGQGCIGTWRCNNPNTAPTWVRISASSDADARWMDSFAYDSTNNILYAGGGCGNLMWRCTNPNTSPNWSNLGGDFEYRSIYSLAYDGNHNLLYAGTGSGLFCCTDPNTSSNWSDTGIGVSDSIVNSIAYDCSREVIYASVVEGVIYRCDNLEADHPSWADMGMDPCDDPSRSLTYDSTNNVLYVCWSGGTWRCDNPNTTPEWTSLVGEDQGEGENPLDASCFTYDHIHNVLYTGTTVGVWRCDNPNTTPNWTNTEGDIRHLGIGSIAYDSTNNVVYAGADYWTTTTYEGHGVWRCKNPDTDPEWTKASTSDDVGDGMIHALTHDSVRNKLYASAQTGEGTEEVGSVWRCDNPDASPAWTDTVSEGMLSGRLDCLVYDPENNLLYVGTDQGVCFCTNPDTDPVWENTGDDEMPYTVNALMVTPPEEGEERAGGSGASSTIYAGTGGQGVWYADSQASSQKTWYLAEGSTGTNEQGSFETWVLVQNPGSETATVTLTYMTPSGEVTGPTQQIGAGSRTTFNVADTPEVANEFNVSTKVTSDKPVIAERAMYWNAASGPYRRCAHDSIGVTGTASTWYLAEGSTGTNEQGTFETWVLVQNPGEETATVSLTYMTPSGEVAGPTKEIAPGSRDTFNVADTPEVAGEFNVSTRVTSDKPVIAERAMYWNASDGTFRQCAHDSIGVTGTASTWYLAEGSTGTNEQGTFETWVLVQNPGSETATVTLTYMTPAGEVAGPTKEIAAGSRDTFNVADTPEVAGEFNVSTRVTSDKPVIAERAMYWNASDGTFRQCAHDSIGVTGTANTWDLAEGSTGTNEQGTFETWVLVQNPGSETATVSLTYMTPSGEIAGPSMEIAAGSRQSFNVADTPEVANVFSVSTRVTSDRPVIAERAMYWNPVGGPFRQAAHDSIGVGL